MNERIRELAEQAGLNDEIFPLDDGCAHAVIAGALFDFMGWLTSRKERLLLSSSDDASPAVVVITEFAKMRGLSLEDAKVTDWNATLQPPAQQEPVAWVEAWANGKVQAHEENCFSDDPVWLSNPIPLYTSPQKREWVGLTDDEIDVLVMDSDGLPKSHLEFAKAIEANLKEKNT